MAIPIKIRITQFLFLAIISVFAISCGKKNIKKASLADSPQQTASDSLTEDLDEQEGTLRGKSYAADPEVRTVYFNFDRAELSEEARATISENAAILRKRASVEIQISGYCDERGTTEYNLALGQRRANAVRDYYKALGVKMGSMSTISYGEENPVCHDSSETCWQRNRRAETLIRNN